MSKIGLWNLLHPQIQNLLYEFASITNKNSHLLVTFVILFLRKYYFTNLGQNAKKYWYYLLILCCDSFKVKEQIINKMRKVKTSRKNVFNCRIMIMLMLATIWQVKKNFKNNIKLTLKSYKWAEYLRIESVFMLLLNMSNFFVKSKFYLF